MATVEIIDTTTDPEEMRRSTRRRLLRYGLPLGSIILVATGLIASTIYTTAMNRADVLALSRNFVDALTERVLTEVRAYQAPAKDAVENLTAALPATPWSEEGRTIFERVATAGLKFHPQISTLYFGTAKGEFLMVMRNAAGTTDTKVIRRTESGPETTWIRRDEKGRVASVEPDKTDRFDPRIRTWYREALTASGVTWSPVYTFSTSQKPGVTASTAVRTGNSAPHVVVGADISLFSLSTFLKGLQKQARGTLIIVNNEGVVVAWDKPERLLIQGDAGPRPRTIRELGQPALAEAFDRVRIGGAARSAVTIDGTRYIFGASSLRDAVARDRVAREWWLILLAPENAYLGFVAANSTRGLIASSGVIVLAIMLAGFLAYQGIVADRNARAVRAGQRQIDDQRQIFDELAGLANLSDIANEEDLRQACEILTRAEGARRISLWRLSSEGSNLTCLGAYETDTKGYTSGIRLNAADARAIISAVSKGQTMEIADAPNDPTAWDLQTTYLQAVGTTALSSLPIESAGQVLGAIWIEDGTVENAITLDHSLTRTVANLLAPRLRQMAAAEKAAGPSAGPHGKKRPAAQTYTAGTVPPDKLLRKASLVDARNRISVKNLTSKSIAATAFPGTTVVAFKLLDDYVLAGSTTGEADSAIIRQVVGAFKATADDAGVAYLKILTDQVVAVDGFGETLDENDLRAAAERLIDVALDVHQKCRAIFLASGQGPQFTMGIDSGTTFGANVGFSDSPYNVWGEAVRVASMLAESAEPGTIQVSETTYDLLRDEYVFRRRGAFFLGQLGEMTTFTLRGRL